MSAKKQPATAHVLSDLESLVWASAFAKGLTLNPDEDALHADATVQRLKSLVNRALPTRAPESAAARASVIIDRDDFDIWYRVQTQVMFGRCADFRIPDSRECTRAYERYCSELESLE